MKVFVDTNVMTAAMLADHPHHEPSREVVSKLRRGRDACAAHSFAELYAALTRMLPPYRRDADEALLLLADIQERVTPIFLNADEYIATISECASKGITGGAVYDGLIAQCALKAKADIIYTWNTRHFQRLGPEIEKRLRVPGV